MSVKVLVEACGHREHQNFRATDRKPTIKIPPKLLAHMRRWHENGQTFVVEWNGKPIKRMQKAFNSAVKDARLDRAVIPHILRHTAATWLMQGGCDLWQASRYLGMTVEVLQERYGHHHPDFSKEVHDAFDRGKKKMKSNMTARQKAA